MSNALREAVLYLLRENQSDRRGYPGMDTTEVDDLLERVAADATS